MSCNFCLKNFNSTSRTPLLLTCTHIYCKKCIQIIKENFNYCPLDRKKILYDSTFKYSEKLESLDFICKLHQSPILALCISHLQLTCKFCEPNHNACDLIPGEKKDLDEIISQVYSISLNKSSYFSAILDENNTYKLDEILNKLDLKINEVKGVIDEISQISNPSVGIIQKLNLKKRIKKYFTVQESNNLIEPEEIKFGEVNYGQSNPQPPNSFIDFSLQMWANPDSAKYFRNILSPLLSHRESYINKNNTSPLFKKILKCLDENDMPIYLYNEFTIETSKNKQYACFLVNIFKNIFIIKDFAIGTPSEPNGAIFIESMSLTINNSVINQKPFHLNYLPGEVFTRISLESNVIWGPGQDLWIQIEIRGEKNHVFFNPFLENLKIISIQNLNQNPNQNFPILFLNLSYFN